ncbi:MAG: hypothetical protein LBE79_00505 [Tannerella sp.]|nr:hypothetical protein [Tannerella sp.]
MKNCCKHSPGRDEMWVEKKNACNRRPVRDDICRENVAYLTARSDVADEFMLYQYPVPDGTFSR